MRKTLLIILAIAMSMTVLSASLSAVTSEQSSTQPNFWENTAMAEWQSVVEDECEHDFYEWSYRSTSDIDGTKYHHRECRKCGYIECELHENRYGGCSICDYGTFDFSTVNLSDTSGMTATELRKYMSDVFGETNIYDDAYDYFRVKRGDFLNLKIDAVKHSWTKIPDYVECLDIYMNIWDPTEEQLSGCFYLMDGIKMGDTRGHMLSEAETRGYKIKTKDKAFDEKLVTIDDGKSIFEFKYYVHKNEDGSYDDDLNEYVEQGYLFTCRDCYGGSHPQHDLSGISIDGILGMDVDEGTVRLKEAFGEECVEVIDSDFVTVDRTDVSGYCDYVALSFYAKKVGNKYIFNSIRAGGFGNSSFSDHVDMKPNIISDMPNTMTVREINKLAEEVGATIYEQDDTLHFQEVPEGSKTIIYNFKLDKYLVEYRVHNYRTIFEAQSRGGYELIPDDEWQDTLAAIVDVVLLDSALPITPADVNSDGEVTLDDAVITLQKAMNVSTDSGTFIDQAADVTGDGEVTLDDAIEILKIAMKVNS